MTYVPQPIYDNRGVPQYPTSFSPEQLAEMTSAAAARDLARVDEARRRDAEAAAERERVAQEAARAELDRYEESAKAAHLRAGGDATTWARAWPLLRDEYLLNRTRAGLSGYAPQVAAAVAAYRAAGHPTFG
jgi:hypothetical protein